ncbi:MAG: hypothetical protein GWM98_01100 [Nitrospinaceae bacterium]|nr:hypothetical protein [Nitrospinaceae bacterium]
MDDEAPGKNVATDDALFGKRATVGVLRVNRDLFRQSSLGFIFTDRQLEGRFNRVGGLDGRLKFSPNWTFEFQGLASRTRTEEEEEESLAGPAYHARLERSGRSFDYSLTYDDFSPGFQTDLGFVRRVDLREIRQFAVYRFWPEGNHLIAWGPRLFLRRNWDHSGTPQDWTTSPGFVFDLRRRTSLEVQFRHTGELFENIRFSKRRFRLEVFSAWIPQAEISLDYEQGTEVNFNPPEGSDPFLGSFTNVDLRATLLPVTPLRIENTYLFTALKQRGTDASVFNDHIIRSKINYQFSRELSLRAILQYEATHTNPTLTSLSNEKRLSGDFLITYLVHPGTALYVGYTSIVENIDPRLIKRNDELLRTGNRFLESAKQFFVKFSYLYRF